MGRPMAVKVRSIDKPGIYGDPNGLYLNVAKGGSKSWVHRITIDGVRRDIGLGDYPDVSLAQAREQAAGNRSAIASGVNSIVEKRRATTPTFRGVAFKVYPRNLPTWRNEKHAAQWLSPLQTYAFPVIGEMKNNPVRKVEVLACLTPIWTAKSEKARRMRQRMRAVFSWAMAHYYVEHNSRRGD